MSAKAIANLVDGAACSQAFRAFRTHNSDTRVSTELLMLTNLRLHHGTHHVTRTDPARCDLHGFAAAGHATMSRSNDECYDGFRYYKPPKVRLSGEKGTLHDHVSFAQWQYTWKDHTFLMYEMEYMGSYPPPTKLYYILSPKNLIVKGEEPPTDQLIMAVGAWSKALHSEIYVFDDMDWNKSKELWDSVQGSSWDDVILNADMKANLISDVQGFFDNQSLYKKLAVPWKRGLILHGVPGNGKTISIKALIASLAARADPVPSLYVKSFDHCQSEKHSIRTIFRHARNMAPCLLIFEDLDSLVTDRTRSYFLNEVDGLESNDGILMIGSTNHLESLDPAISKRPSRFDRKYHFKIPDEEERTSYARFWRTKLLDTDMVEFPEELSEVIGKLSAGFSFAYMKELFVASLLTIARGVPVETDVEETPTAEDEKSTDAADTFAIVQKDSQIFQEIAALQGDAQDQSESKSEKTAAAAATTRSVPEIEIPEALRNNVLLRVLRSEMKTLLDEMDSTKEENWPSDRKTVNADGGMRRMGVSYVEGSEGSPFDYMD